MFRTRSRIPLRRRRMHVEDAARAGSVALSPPPPSPAPSPPPLSSPPAWPPCNGPRLHHPRPCLSSRPRPRPRPRHPLRHRAPSTSRMLTRGWHRAALASHAGAVVVLPVGPCDEWRASLAWADGWTTATTRRDVGKPQASGREHWTAAPELWRHGCAGLSGAARTQRGLARVFACGCNEDAR